MKKSLLWGAIATLFFASCSKNEFGVDSTIEQSGDFVAMLSNETRTELKGTSVVWNAEDELTIFTKTEHNRQYKVKDLSEDGRTATFGYVNYTGTSSNAINANYAVYPYNVEATISGDVISTAVAAEQVYNAEKVDLSNALMVAKSESNSFAFVNAGALMRFNISKSELLPDSYTLVSIKLSSAANNIAGDVTIDLGADSKAVVSSNGSKEITLTAINAEITTDAQSFYVALPATTFADKDLSVSFTFADGVKTFALPAFDLIQGSIKTIAYKISDFEDFTGTTPGDDEDFEGETPDAEPKPASNEIFYTTTDGEIIELSDYGYQFGDNVHITSNVYENGKGVITLDSDATHLVEAFENFENLQTVTLPDGITEILSYAFNGCSNLTTINFGDGITSFNKTESIVNCSNLSKFKGSIASNDGRCLILDGELFYVVGLEGLTSYTLPEGIQSLYASFSSTTLTTLSLPNSLTNIVELGTRNLPALKAFAGAFASADGSCLVIDGELSYFAPVALEGLTSYSVPNNVTKIASQFPSSTTLTTVIFPEGCTAITAKAPKLFNYCPNMQSVQGGLASTDGKCIVANNTLIELVDKMLTSYTIPTGINAIYDSAFTSGNITSITVPASVTEIGYMAFSNSNINAVHFESTTPANLNGDLFNSFVVKNIKFYVPTEAVETYKASERWTTYESIIEGYDF